MKKNELVRLVMDQCGVEYGDRTVALKISQVFNTVCGQVFGKNNSQYEFFSKRVTLPVVNRVVTLTIPLIQTPTTSNGVPRIQLTGSTDTALPDNTVCYPVPGYATANVAAAAQVGGFVFYTVTGNEVRFTRALPAGVTEVIATVIPEFQGYGDEDYIQLPAGVSQTIIDLSVASVLGQPASTNVFKK